MGGVLDASTTRLRKNVQPRSRAGLDVAADCGVQDRDTGADAWLLRVPWLRLHLRAREARHRRGLHCHGHLGSDTAREKSHGDFSTGCGGPMAFEARPRRQGGDPAPLLSRGKGPQGHRDTLRVLDSGMQTRPRQAVSTLCGRVTASPLEELADTASRDCHRPGHTLTWEGP